jgi:hypothetical protein
LNEEKSAIFVSWAMADLSEVIDDMASEAATKLRRVVIAYAPMLDGRMDKLPRDDRRRP